LSVIPLWELGKIDPGLTFCVAPASVSGHCVRESQLRYGDSVDVIGLGKYGELSK
jgi:hypothetical protein